MSTEELIYESFEKADELYENKEYDSALKELNTLFEKPDNGDANEIIHFDMSFFGVVALNKAKCYKALNKPDEVIKILTEETTKVYLNQLEATQLFQVNCHLADAYGMKADLNNMDEYSSKAIHLAMDQLSSDSLTARAYDIKLHWYSENSQWDKSVAVCKDAITFGVDNDMFELYLLGKENAPYALYENGMTKESKDEAEDNLKIWKEQGNQDKIDEWTTFIGHISADGINSISLEGVTFAKDSTDKEHRHYVNIDTDKKPDGHLNITFDANKIKDGDYVYWEIVANEKNIKLNDVIHGVKESNDSDTIPFTKKVITGKTKVTNKKAIVTLVCGTSGGNSYTVKCGTMENNYTFEFTSVNWRKIWFQVAAKENFKFPKYDYAVKEYEKAFIELIHYADINYTRNDLTNTDKMYYKERDFISNGSEKDYVVLTDENRDQFINNSKIFDLNKVPICAYIIVSDEYRDKPDENKIYVKDITINEKKEVNKIITSYKKINRDNNTEYEYFNEIVIPPLYGTIITPNTEDSDLQDNSHWILYNYNGEELDNGLITDDDIKIDPNRTSMSHIKLQLPKHAMDTIPEKSQTFDPKTNYIKCTLFYHAVGDYEYGRAEKAPYIFSICNEKYPEPKYDINVENKKIDSDEIQYVKNDFMNTIIHEIAHGLSLVPDGVDNSNDDNHCQNKCTMRQGIYPDKKTFCKECLTLLKKYDCKKLA